MLDNRIKLMNCGLCKEIYAETDYTMFELPYGLCSNCCKQINPFNPPNIQSFVSFSRWLRTNDFYIGNN